MSDTPTPNETQSQQNGSKRGGNGGGNRALLPILLIAAGVLLLLGRVGWFDWNLAFGILQLWPLLLIAVGVDILTQGRFRAAVVIVTVLVGALLWRAPAWSPFSGTAAEVQTIEYPIDGARSADIDLEHGVGVLMIDDLPDADGRLLAGTIATGRGETLEAGYRIDDGVAEVDLRARQRGTGFSIGGRGDQRRWDLELARDLPIDLTIDSGVGESTLDLRDLILTAFDLDAGVGEVTIVMPSTGGFEGSVDAGVGEVTVRIPRDVEVLMDVETGLGGVDVRGSWARDGDTYRTDGYDDADDEDRIELDLSGGVGQITVERVN